MKTIFPKGEIKTICRRLTLCLGLRNEHGLIIHMERIQFSDNTFSTNALYHNLNICIEALHLWFHVTFCFPREAMSSFSVWVVLRSRCLPCQAESLAGRCGRDLLNE